jgi:acyl dehydratase
VKTLYLKALLPLGGGDELPDKEESAEYEIDRHRLAEYDRVCGFRLRDEAPTTFPHVLGFPLQMQLMTSRDFPFQAIGMVHIENRIEQERPLKAGETVTVRVRATDLRDHPKGRQFDMVTEVGDHWRSWSTYLKREGGDGSSGEREESEPPEPNAIWDVPGHIGRSYASVSGDINPIHMHSLSAKLFGMPGAIAHGMWMKARCLASLENHLRGPHRAEVSFKTPLKIPGKAAFSGETEFALHNARSGKPHLTGKISPL